MERIVPNTLGLDDDLEPVEVRETLEAAFDMRFSNAEALACLTVGDVYEIVRGRFSSSGDGRTGCVSAMAFYRLRRAFSRLSVEPKLRPNVELNRVTDLTAKALFKELGSRTDFRMPRHACALSDCG